MAVWLICMYDRPFDCHYKIKEIIILKIDLCTPVHQLNTKLKKKSFKKSFEKLNKKVLNAFFIDFFILINCLRPYPSFSGDNGNFSDKKNVVVSEVVALLL